MTPAQNYTDSRRTPRTTIYSTLLVLSIVIFICIIGILALVPPVSRDALIHHLAIPKLYLAHGGIYELPDLIFSYYPMNLDLLYMIPLSFGNDYIPKFIHMFFGLATAWLIYIYLKNRLGLNWGLAGALFFLTTPIVIHLATTAYVDLGVTFFTTASVLFIVKWYENQQIKTILFAGFCAGLAAGTKYNGLLTIFILTLFVPFLANRSKKSLSPAKSAGVACLFLGCALIVVSPWLIRNFLWTANPIYPLFQSLFNTDQIPLTQGANPLLIRKLIYNESLLQTLLIPIRIFFEGQDNNPQYFDGILNPFLLLLPLAVFIPNSIAPSLKKDKKLFFWFISLFFMFAFVQRVVRIRYIVPVLPFIVMLSILGIYNLQQYLKTKYLRKVALILPTLLIAIAFSLNGIYLVNYWQKINPLDYITGKSDRSSFVSHFWPEYPLIMYANKNLPQSSNILAVFLGNRGYYFDRAVLFDMVKGKSQLCTLIKETHYPIQINSNLTERGITHLLIRHDLFNTFCYNRLKTEEQQRFTNFIDIFTKPIAHNGNHSLICIEKNSKSK